MGWRPVCVFLLLVVGGAPLGASVSADEWFAAARRGDVPALKAMLTRGADVNAKTAYGATALHFAADKGHVEAVKLLIEHKANVNAKDTFYTATPLTWALYRERWGVIQALVEAGAEGADSVLGTAVAKGKADLVRAIVARGKLKPATLSAALEKVPADHPEIADVLKKAGARPAAKSAGASNDVKVDTQTLASYVGTYQDSDQQFGVALADGKLALQSDGRTLSLLTPIDAATFRLASQETAKVVFQKADGKVTGFTLKIAGSADSLYRRVEPKAAAKPTPAPVVAEDTTPVTAPANWPSFRGPSASGVADGQHPPVGWDVKTGRNVRWKTSIPGLGHSCPIVWGDRVFVTTAISGDPKATLRVGQYGDVDSVNDSSVHTWKVFCLDKHSGRVAWERTAHQGVPKVKRHLKATHANSTPATDGRHVVACFGSEGLYCYDFAGKLLWKKDLGALDSGWFYDPDYQWGFGSSPVLYHGTVIVQCDAGKNSFIAAYDAETGNRLWATPREEVPSWGTPTVVEAGGRAEVVTNATKFIRAYDARTGKELWRLGKNAEITVPTPVFGEGLVFVTSGYRPIQPIYAVRPGGSGDLTLEKGKDSSAAIAWSKPRGGPYMPTPLVYGGCLYTMANNGMLTCYDAKTGKQIYKERLGGKGGYTASPVAADGRLYFASEEGEVRVVKAGPGHEVLATNTVDDVCMATPAVSDGMIFIRTQHTLYALGRPATPR